VRQRRLLPTVMQNKPQNQTFTVFGTGGNINQALKIIAPNTKATLSLGSLKNLHEELMALSFEERCLQFQLKPDRADVIVPALQIYMAALNALGQESLVVPKIGLADGVIYQLFLEHTNL
jgi:exopolyphosphatase/guanosine-5'-triphosphate,3'-diphosphate pyrophosphatase